MMDLQMAGVSRRVRVAWVAVVMTATGVAGLTLLRAESADPEAAKVKNPISVSEASLTAGQAVYYKSCRPCHSRDGGGSASGPSLTDDVWTNGATDGEIYAVIRKGVAETRMEPWDDRVSEEDTWNLVNYIRSLKTGAGK